MECPNEIFHSNKLNVRTIWVAPGATNAQLTFDISNSQGDQKIVRYIESSTYRKYGFKNRKTLENAT